ncbi:unnamed protein product [Pseudo-nitzschia multistriata]|uniref:Uncharacterized protein n=1 Tax=Pseudo-nitzschia multistriata TaxID=183589 RepID=A0A448ZSK8_9STRA|nr:unnamed protein product [Pseudo-nitzschia multistriata]
MGFIPHPSMPIGVVRPHDIIVLLLIGAAFELCTRLSLVKYKRKPDSIRQREYALKDLEIRVRKSRALGPHAFVETSKLERQMLSEEKNLSDLAGKRQKALEKSEKLVGRIGTALNFIVFVCWYGIPMMEFSGHRVLSPDTLLSREESAEMAASAFNSYMFPLSYLGMGVRISKWGLANPKASTGALLVVWSAQTTVGKIMDGLETLLD